MVTSKEVAQAYVVFSAWLEDADIPDEVSEALAVIFEYAGSRVRELERAVSALTGV